MNTPDPTTDRTTAAAAAAEPDTEQEAAKVSRRWPLISGAIAVGLVAGLGALIAYRQSNLPLAFDVEWMDELLEERHAFWEVPAVLMNNVGGGV
ncbi:MAG TPA: hypothetical protein VGP24_09690, partial [Glaciihabitans sp.]|nr:hypothetical protein [Glaciihabitans sp.]